MRRLLLAVAALAIAGESCRQPEARPKVLTPVRAAAVETAAASGETTYSANIVANTQVGVAFRVGGYVAELHQVAAGRALQEGDFIQKGTVLARVRQEDYDLKVRQAKAGLAEAAASLVVAKSQLAEADASLQQAEIDFRRASALFESQSLTKADLDSAATRLAVARARAAAAAGQVEAIQRRVEAAGEQVREGEIAFADSNLTAPIDGIVLHRPIEVGALVNSGVVGVVLADTRSVKAVFGVPDSTVARLRLGQTFTIRTDAIPDNDFPGRITRIAPAADTHSRLFEVELSVPNGDRRLRPGMIASVTIFEPGPRARVPVVPLAAIRPSKTDRRYAVFALERRTPGYVARMRYVRLGEAVGNAIAVLEGVNPGELVVTDGSNQVNDGESVQLVP